MPLYFISFTNSEGEDETGSAYIGAGTAFDSIEQVQEMYEKGSHVTGWRAWQPEPTPEIRRYEALSIAESVRPALPLDEQQAITAVLQETANLSVSSVDVHPLDWTIPDETGEVLPPGFLITRPAEVPAKPGPSPLITLGGILAIAKLLGGV